MPDYRNLYKVTVRGLEHPFKEAFVLAYSAQDAYQERLKYLCKHNIGLSKDRELQSVILFAESPLVSNEFCDGVLHLHQERRKNT